MHVSDIKVQQGSLQKLHNLLKDKKVYGVHYTNNLLSRDYIARPMLLGEYVNLKEETVQVKLTQRVDMRGLGEMEATLYMFQHLTPEEGTLIGDLPGFTPEGLLQGSGIDEQDQLPDTVTPTQELFSVDVLLNWQKPEITYQEFTISGSKFTLVEMKYEETFSYPGEEEDGEEYDDNFTQVISLLFGEPGKMYFFSHFDEKKLNSRDCRLIIDLVKNQNITGKFIKAAYLFSGEGSATLYPYKEALTLYNNTGGDLILGNGSGYFGFYKNALTEVLSCYILPNKRTGGCDISLRPKKLWGQVRLVME
jgi:hypothetical protein